MEFTESVVSSPSKTEAVHEIAPGTVVADRYRIEALLGKGGMGSVYRAEHVHMRKLVAVKILHGKMSSSEEVVMRFEREAIAMANIDHPNVTMAHDFGRLDDGSFYLVLEYVDGHTLRSDIKKGRIEPGRALRIVRSIVAALEAAHARGIVHRDLKPENVMLLHRSGYPDFVKVLDFGIAKLDAREMPQVAGDQPITRAGTIFGTPDYMSPEQALGQSADARADLYSIGVILFEMLAGERPFKGDLSEVLRQHVLGEIPKLPAEVLRAVPAELPRALERLLDKDPDKRFANATELGEALDAMMVTATMSMRMSPEDLQRALRGLAANRPSSGQHSVTMPHGKTEPISPWRVGAIACFVGVLATFGFTYLHAARGSHEPMIAARSLPDFAHVAVAHAHTRVEAPKPAATATDPLLELPDSAKAMPVPTAELVPPPVETKAPESKPDPRPEPKALAKNDKDDDKPSPKSRGKIQPPKGSGRKN
ncbi:MAG: protein kinase [Polyangiaceae bacterium]